MANTEHERLLLLEMRVNRLVSDAESEKRTRAQANADVGMRLDAMDNRLREVERTMWKAAGALGLLLAMLEISLKYIK